MLRNSKIFLLGLSIFFILFSCKNEYTPKPKAYPRIGFPEKKYVKSDLDYPYSFEYPVYSELEIKVATISEPYWLNILVKDNNAKIHISYKTINNNLASLIEDSRDLAYKHSIKANAINEKLFLNHDKQVYGTLYEIKGNVASPLQLHLTDSVNHFLRASFYISEIPNYDSLSPVIDFLEKDIYHFVETLSWE